MSLGEAVGLAVVILGGMFVMLFALAALEEGMFAEVLTEVEEDPVPAQPEPLQQAA